MTTEMSRTYCYENVKFTVRRRGEHVSVKSPDGTEAEIREEEGMFLSVDNETVFNENLQAVVDYVCGQILIQESNARAVEQKYDDFFSGP